MYDRFRDRPVICIEKSVITFVGDWQMYTGRQGFGIQADGPRVGPNVCSEGGVNRVLNGCIHISPINEQADTVCGGGENEPFKSEAKLRTGTSGAATHESIVLRQPRRVRTSRIGGKGARNNSVGCVKGAGPIYPPNAHEG